MSDADARKIDQRSSDIGMYGGRSGDRELYQSPSFPVSVKNILKNLQKYYKILCGKKTDFDMLYF